jgi:hypothetical protein
MEEVMNLLNKPIRVKYTVKNDQTINMKVGKTYWAIALVNESGYLKYVVINDNDTAEIVPAHLYPIVLEDIGIHDTPVEQEPKKEILYPKPVQEEVTELPKEEENITEAGPKKKNMFEVKRVRN